MGGTGSGRVTVKSKAFDLADFCEDVLRHLQRNLAGDAERAYDWEVVEDWQVKLDLHKKQLVQAIERETQGE